MLQCVVVDVAQMGRARGRGRPHGRTMIGDPDIIVREMAKRERRPPSRLGIN